MGRKRVAMPNNIVLGAKRWHRLTNPFVLRGLYRLAVGQVNSWQYLVTWQMVNETRFSLASAYFSLLAFYKDSDSV
jgi:hypothetical protein